MAKRFIQRRASKYARRLLAVLAVVCLAAPLIPAAPQKAPLVFMMLTRRDLGDVYQGEEIEQVFPVRNDGDAPLEMDNKRLTGQAAPPRRLEPASAFRVGRLESYGLMPAAVRRAAPS